jgi:hypothetical protein
MRRSLRKSKCKRNQSGGGLGGGWGFAPSSLGPTVNNVLAYEPIGNCREVQPATLRPGYLEGGYTGPKGLPGMSGGARKRKASRKGSRSASRKNRKASRKNRKASRKLRKQSGGRYGMGPFDGAGMGTPWGSAIAPTMRIPCEASYSAIPDSGAANTLNKVGGPLWDSAARPAGSQLGGGGAVAGSAAATSWSEPASTSQAASITVPTAGLTHLRNPDDAIQTAAGTLEMINVPENGRIMNPACLKTGGGRKGSRKGSRSASRKNRKASRKGNRSASRKASRKNRKGGRKA